MGAYEDYLSQIDYENYLQQINQEDSSKAGPKPYQLGPNYDQSIAANAGKGLIDFPPAAIGMVTDAAGTLAPDPTIGDAISRGLGAGDGFLGGIEKGAIDALTGPVSGIAGATLKNPERAARTVGELSAGTAGAIPGAEAGATVGTYILPGAGTIAGGILGGGLGYGAGLLGFNLTTDLATGQNQDKSYEQYLKDLAYNSTQATAFGALGTGGKAGFDGARGAFGGGPPPEARVNTALSELQPGYGDQIDPALAANANDPFLAQKSLGELLNSDVLKNAQRTLARSGPEGYARATEANAGRNDAQLRFLDQLDQSPATVEDAQNAIKEGQDLSLAASQRGISQAQDAVTAGTSNLPPGIAPEDAGALIRDAASTNKQELQAKVRQAFQGIGDGTVDPSPVRDVISQSMPQYFKDVGAQPDSALVELANQFTKTGEPVIGANGQPMVDPSGQPITKPVTYTMQDVQAGRSKALEIAQGGDPRSAAVANQIADALLKVGDTAVASGTVTPEQAANWQSGIKLRKEQGKLFESSATPAKSVLAKQPYGEFRLPESAIPSKYFRAGEKGVAEAIQNYKATVGADDASLEPLYRYAVDSFRDAAVNADGTVDSKAANSWLNRHSAALRELPVLKAQLSDVHSAQQFLNEKFGDLKRTQAEVDNGALRSFLQADPESAIKAMLSGKDMVKRTSAVADYIKRNSPEALAGLRRGVIEHLKKNFIPTQAGGVEEALASGTQFQGDVLGGTFAKELSRIRPALEKSGLFTESQLKGLDDLYSDKRSQLSVEKAKMPGGSDSAQNLTTMGVLLRMGRNAFIKAIPFGAGTYIKTILEPLLQSLPQGKFESLMQEALLNPRIARDLYNKANAKNLTRSASEIFGSLGLSRSPVAEQEAKRESPKPPKLTPPNQQKVIARETFPHPQKLLHPPASGKLQKVSLDTSNLDAETRARIAVESGGNPAAVSPKGAQGLSQLMPATANEIAAKRGETYNPLRPNMSPEERQASINQNVLYGDLYFKQLLGEFKDQTLARAAYNAGPQRVRNAMILAGSSTDVNKILSNLPAGVKDETLPYVKSIDNLARRYGQL